jgi:diacylglycerol kinase family enzyme
MIDPPARAAYGHAVTGHPERRRRLVALLALLALLGAVAASVVALTQGSLGRLVVVALALIAAVVGGWYVLAGRGAARIAGGLVAAAAVLAVVLVLLTSARNGLALELALVLVAVSLVASKRALADALAAGSDQGAHVERPRHPVLIMNPWSGGGKVEKFNLVDECRSRGIEPVVLARGDDLLQLASDAVAGGADVIGMAGGDGSQALVASVASRHGVPHVCIPAGTRNHFALDLGLDRDDVVGALDAFGEAVERRIDLATVNGRVFVNNASMGIYAKIVQSPEYRDAKLTTAAAMLPDMLGTGAEPFDLRFTGPDGTEVPTAHMILVSNDPYELDHLDGRGSRLRLDSGTLGIAAARITNAREAVAFTQLEATGRIRSFSGWSEWETPRFEINSSGPVEIGIDGEATSIEPPLVFESHPAALRIRIPTHARGVSPAALALPGLRAVVPALIAVVSGRPPALAKVEHP